MAGGMSRMAKRELLASITRPLPGVFQEGQGPDSRRVHRRDRPSPEAWYSPAGDNQVPSGGPRVWGERPAHLRRGSSGGGDPGVGSIGPHLREASESGACPHLVDSMERHGHLDLDPEVRERLLSASAATLDRLLKPVRVYGGQPAQTPP